MVAVFSTRALRPFLQSLFSMFSLSFFSWRVSSFFLYKTFWLFSGLRWVEWLVLLPYGKTVPTYCVCICMLSRVLHLYIHSPLVLSRPCSSFHHFFFRVSTQFSVNGPQTFMLQSVKFKTTECERRGRGGGGELVRLSRLWVDESRQLQCWSVTPTHWHVTTAAGSPPPQHPPQLRESASLWCWCSH